MGRTSTAKERLIDAARQLIWQRGYAAVGVNELCRQADVRPGSFYYFFPSKRDLLLAALEENWLQTQTTVLEPAFAPAVATQERIPKIFELAYQQQQQRLVDGGRVVGCAFGSMGSELGHQDEIVRQKVEEIFGRFRTYFEWALTEAAESGLLEIDDIPARAHALLAYLEGVLLLARTHNNAEVISQLSPMALTLAGFRPVSQQG